MIDGNIAFTANDITTDMLSADGTLDLASFIPKIKNYEEKGINISNVFALKKIICTDDSLEIGRVVIAYCEQFVDIQLSNLQFMQVFSCPLFVGDKLSSLHKLEVVYCPLFVGDKLPALQELIAFGNDSFVGDKLPALQFLTICYNDLFVGDKLPDVIVLFVYKCPKAVSGEYLKEKYLNLISLKIDGEVINLK